LACCNRAECQVIAHGFSRTKKVTSVLKRLFPQVDFQIYFIFSLLLIYFLHSIKNGTYRSRSIRTISFAKKKITPQNNNSKNLSAFVDCALYQRFTFFTSVDFLL